MNTVSPLPLMARTGSRVSRPGAGHEVWQQSQYGRARSRSSASSLASTRSASALSGTSARRSLTVALSSAMVAPSTSVSGAMSRAVLECMVVLHWPKWQRDMRPQMGRSCGPQPVISGQRSRKRSVARISLSAGAGHEVRGWSSAQQNSLAGSGTRTDTATTKPMDDTAGHGTGEQKIQTRSDAQPGAALYPTSETPWLVSSTRNVAAPPGASKLGRRAREAQRKRPLLPAALGNRGPNSVKGTRSEGDPSQETGVMPQGDNGKLNFLRALVRAMHVLQLAFGCLQKEKDRRGQRSKLQSSTLWRRTTQTSAGQDRLCSPLVWI